MKVHLGCGNNILDNYINVDISSINNNKEGYMQSDAIAFLQGADKNSIQEIKSELFMEHLTRTESCRLLYYSHRALGINGIFDVTVPVFNPEHPMWNTSEKDEILLNRKLYGLCGPSEPDSWEYLHKFIYDKEILITMLELFSFCDIEEIVHPVWGSSVVRLRAKKKEQNLSLEKYNVSGEYSGLFSNVYLHGAEDEYAIHQISHKGRTIISSQANLFRTWFTIKPAYVKEIDINIPRNHCFGFYDSWYFSFPEDIPSCGQVDIIPFSCMSPIRGSLVFDFSSLPSGFVNDGFVNNEVLFIKD